MGNLVVNNEVEEDVPVSRMKRTVLISEVKLNTRATEKELRERIEGSIECNRAGYVTIDSLEAIESMLSRPMHSKLIEKLSAETGW